MGVDILNDLCVVRIDLLKEGNHSIHKVAGMSCYIPRKFCTVNVHEESPDDVPFHCEQNRLVRYRGQVHNCVDECWMLARLALERSDSYGQFNEIFPRLPDS